MRSYWIWHVVNDHNFLKEMTVLDRIFSVRNAVGLVMNI